jgi:hypothetical protein
LKQTSSNINRFVRDISFKVIKSIFDVQMSIKNDKEINSMNYDLAEMISKGLEDSWSEIRYAASLAVRSFY